MSGCLWYSLTTVQGRPRDWFKVKQYLELPDCCQAICQGLAEYVNDPLCFFTGAGGLSATGRVHAAMDTFEARCEATSLARESDHSEHRRDGAYPDRCGTTIAAKAATHVRSRVARTVYGKGGRDLYTAPANLRRRYQQAVVRPKLSRRGGPTNGITLFWKDHLTDQDRIPMRTVTVMPQPHLLSSASVTFTNSAL